MSLEDKRIVLTGTVETIDNMASLLSPKKARVIPFPTISVQTDFSKTNRSILQSISNFSWLVFTSKQGVRSFFKLTEKENLNILPSNLKIAVIGKKTADVLNEYGYPPAFVNEGRNKQDMLKHWRRLLRKQDHVLLAVSHRADEALEEALKEKVRVKRLDVYSSQMPQEVDEKVRTLIKDGHFDHVVFTSPSAVRNFQKMVGKLSGPRKILSIGPTTSKALQEEGCTHFYEAAKPSAESIVETLEELYTNQKTDHGIS